MEDGLTCYLRTKVVDLRHEQLRFFFSNYQSISINQNPYSLVHLFYLRMKLNKPMTTLLPARKQQNPVELEPSSKVRT